jgi:hypothetical protein
MLLKFCVENSFSEHARKNSRKKYGAPRPIASLRPQFSHWLKRHFTGVVVEDRIHSALIEFSTNNLSNFSRGRFRAIGKADET